MKKFTKIIICLLLCVVSFSLVACGNGDKNKDNYVYPTSADRVSGNDGLAVRCGNYIYFVNGMKSVESMANKKDTYTVGSLMIMKLDSNGQVVRNEDEIINAETYTTISDRLCGFEATGLFINGDYLYFTTPCLEDEGGKSAGKDPEWAKDRVEFYRVKLNNSAEPEKIYQSSVKYEDLSFKYYAVNGNTFILVYEQGESKDEKGTDVLVRVDANAKNSSVVATNIASLTMDAEYNTICYVTKNGTENKLFGYNIETNTSTSCKYSSSSAFTVVKSINNKVFIEDDSHLYVSDYSVCNFGGVQTISNIDKFEDNMYISDDGEYFIGIKDAKIEVISTDGEETSAKITVEGAESLTFIGLVNGNVVFMDNNNNIKSVSYYEALENDNKEISTIAKIENINTDYFDIDGNYLYFYKTIEEVNYLHRVALNNIYVEGETAEEMISVK